MNKYKNISYDDLHVMHILSSNPNLSQRELAKKTDISLGKINYCLKALIKTGYVKLKNFKGSSNKLKYAYILTPSGIQKKTKITKKFIEKNLQEYNRLESYLD